MAISENYVLRAISAAFVWAFRGVPLIVQIFFWFNIALFVPDIKFAGYAVSVNAIVTPEVAGLLALGLHEAANMSEVIRSGLLSVDFGQYDACRALGLTRGKALRNIILPQALRVIIPPTGNQAIGMLKASAIVSVIGMEDLLTQAQHIYARNFLVTELLAVASIWYLALTTVASIGQYYLERYFARGFGRRNVKRAPPKAGEPSAAAQ
jgi:polar amino acid transport system permease protein